LLAQLNFVETGCKQSIFFVSRMVQETVCSES